MATEAQFRPAQAPGAITAASRAGMVDGFSMMDRAQIMRLRQQEEARRQAHDNIMRPVTEAKAKADIATAAVHLDGLRRAEETRTAMTSLLPAAREHFDNLMLLENPEDREMLATEWMGKYAQLDSVAEFAPEFSAKKEIIARALVEAEAVRELRRKTAAEKEKIEARGEAEADIVRATGRGMTVEQKLMRQRDSARASGDYELAAEIDEHLAKRKYIAPASKPEAYQRELDEARQRGDQEAIALYQSMLEKEQAAPSNSAEGSEQFFRKYEEAVARGDPEEIDFWRQRITALNRRGVKQDGTGSSGIDALLGVQPGEAKPDAVTAPAIVPPEIKF